MTVLLVGQTIAGGTASRTVTLTEQVPADIFPAGSEALNTEVTTEPYEYPEVPLPGPDTRFIVAVPQLSVAVGAG